MRKHGGNGKSTRSCFSRSGSVQCESLIGNNFNRQYLLFNPRLKAQISGIHDYLPQETILKIYLPDLYQGKELYPEVQNSK